ncbi:MAG TPA: class II aldolase/adducin family protein [Xanthobacteraceae bacterium]|nr:class II aldolase/adducin family protein [Xanthobacteraceae bacterium]
MPTALDDIRRELARANRILAREDVLDAFGHVSVRHPGDPGRYLLSRSRGPELVQADDILEFTLDSEPVVPPTRRLYSERVIHGCIYQARPDVNAVVHHHAPSIMPFVIAGVALVPVFHLGATMGAAAPFWDSRDEFGDTSLLVIKPEEGRSLARALGGNAMVLMRRHGATVVGESLHQVVFRSIYSARNAEFQWRAHALGAVGPLTAGEAKLAAAHNLQPGPIERAWEYWSGRLDKAESLLRAVTAKPRATAPAKSRKAARRRRAKS